MTDYERTTTRETTTTPPVATEPYVAPAAAPAPVATSVRTTDTAYVASGPGPTTYAARVVTFLFGILQVALILRIILLLLVANRGNDVVQFVMNITQPFVDPFIGMFSMNRVTADQGSVLDVAAIVALIGWTLIEALILAAIRIFSRRRRPKPSSPRSNGRARRSPPGPSRNILPTTWLRAWTTSPRPSGRTDRRRSPPRGGRRLPMCRPGSDRR